MQNFKSQPWPRSHDWIFAFCRWCDCVGFIEPGPLKYNRTVWSRVWSGQEKNQDLQLWVQGSYLEKGGLPSPGWRRDPASGGGVAAPVCRADEGTRPGREALDLPVAPHSHPHLWSWVFFFFLMCRISSHSDLGAAWLMLCFSQMIWSCWESMVLNGKKEACSETETLPQVEAFKYLWV